MTFLVSAIDNVKVTAITLMLVGAAFTMWNLCRRAINLVGKLKVFRATAQQDGA